MSNSTAEPVMPSTDEEALDDGPWIPVTLEEAEELGLSCETWEEQKRFDRRLAEERARRASG